MFLFKSAKIYARLCVQSYFKVGRQGTFVFHLVFRQKNGRYMARTSKNAPADQGASLNNEQRINVLLQQSLDNDTIMYGLCRLKSNLAAVEDDDQRKKLAEKYHLEQVPLFDKIFRQRLLEQIRKCKHQYKRENEEIELIESLSDDDGTAKKIRDINIVDIPRISLGISSLDEMLGTDPINGQSGLPVGSCLVFGAPKGVGKTRLTVQIAAAVGNPKAKPDEWGNSGVLFIQNEEKLDVFRTRAAHMWTNEHNILVSSSNNLVQQVALVDKHRPRLVIIDSIQDTRQARFSAGIANMMSTYKSIAGSLHCAFWLISHVNTKGDLKGGTYVGHKVDIELIAEKLLNPSEFVVKCGEKNRYGATGKKAVFMHTADGIVSVETENHRAFAMGQHSLMMKAAVPLGGVATLRRGNRDNDLPVGGLPESNEEE